MELQSKFEELRRTVLKYCIGPNQCSLLEACILAVLTQEHCVAIGPPGSNKTALIDILTHLLGASAHANHRVNSQGQRMPFTFYTTLDKYATPEVLLGPFDPRALRKDGKWVRNMENTIADAHFAFIGEIFSGNGSTLRSLVRVLNEREVTDGGVKRRIPLMSVFADSNHYPLLPMAAVYDRFLFRVSISYLDSNDTLAFLSMLTSPEFNFNTDSAALFQVTDVRSACQQVQAVTVSSGVLNDLHDVRLELLGNTAITLSDRRWKQCVSVLQARAWLNGCTEVQPPDFLALRHVLWDNPKQQERLYEVLSGYDDETYVGRDDAEVAKADTIFDDAMTAYKKSGEVSRLPKALATLVEVRGSLESVVAVAKLEWLIEQLRHALDGGTSLSAFLPAPTRGK